MKLLTHSNWLIGTFFLAVIAGCERSKLTTPEPTTSQPSTSEQEPAPVAQQSHIPNEKDGARQDDTIEIPLAEIWAYNMPGTYKMSANRLASGEYAFPGGAMVLAIHNSLRFVEPEKQVKPSFAVAGTGMDALQSAHKILVDEEDPRETFSLSEEISLIFFSHEFSQYVHLEDVTRRETTITIPYHFVPHGEKVVTNHFALIPLGKLPVGIYKVNVVRSPLEANFNEYGVKPVGRDWELRVVSKSFQFAVEQPGDD
jgi:hypothetical protein